MPVTQGEIRRRTEHGLEGIRFGGGNHSSVAHTGLLQRSSQGLFELCKASGQQHLKIGVALLQRGRRLGQRGHQVAQLLGS